MDKIWLFSGVLAVLLATEAPAQAEEPSTPAATEGATGYPSLAPPGQPARNVKLSVSLSAFDLVGFAFIAGAALNAGANSEPVRLGDRVLSDAGWWAYGGAATAMTGVALFGLVRSGQELGARNKGRADVSSLNWPRTGIAVSSVSASYWLALMGVGIWARRAETTPVALINLIPVALHVWAIAWNAKELKSRKHARTATESKFRMVAPGFFVF